MPPPPLKNLLASFSPRGDYLALCTGDGRIKTWDTVDGCVKGDFVDLSSSSNGNATVADGHLAIDYTCMAWNPITKKGKKKRGPLLLLALGTGSGDVLLLDIALGQLKWRERDCHPGGVKSLVFAKSGNMLYSTGADGMVCEINVDSGELVEKFKASKRAVSRICVSRDGSYLVAGSSDLRLFDLSSKKCLCKFAGHPDTVKDIVYADDNMHFFSSANGERHVALWHNNGNKKSATAVCCLSMEHPAVNLDCSGEFPQSLRVLAVSEAGVVYVWHASSAAELSKVEPIKVVLDNVKGEASSGKRKSSRSTVLAAKFIGKCDKGPGSVLIAFGTTVKPSFEQISLEGKGNIISLEAGQNGALMPATQINNDTAKSVGPVEARVLGPDNAIDVDKPSAHLELGASPNKESKKKKRPLMEINEDNLKPYDHKLNAEDEETMEEKLKALGILENEERDTESNPDMFPTPKADSLQVLMTQALESDDKALLEKCLAVTKERVITKTMRLLSPLNAAKFLQQSSFLIDSRAKRGLVLLPWIKAALLYHASYIMSNPSMQPVLTSLYQAIDARLLVFRSLLSLSGRLELIVAQISNAEESQQREMTAAAVVYEESDGDGDEGEVEDVMDGDSSMESEDEGSDEDLQNGHDPLANHNDGSLDDMMDESDQDF